jgi:hypothetical protein
MNQSTGQPMRQAIHRVVVADNTLLVGCVLDQRGDHKGALTPPPIPRTLHIHVRLLSSTGREASPRDGKQKERGPYANTHCQVPAHSHEPTVW